MKGYTVEIVSKSKDLPPLKSNLLFHSPEYFRIVEETSGHRPLMAIVRDEHGNIAAHLTAIIRRRGSLFPPFLFSQGRIYGEGEYAEDTDREELFGLMLKAVTRVFRRKLCLYAEFSELSQKMFGYRHFRSNGYTPVTWQEIHNSLHSKSPEERLTDKARQRLTKAEAGGVEQIVAATPDDVHAFYKLLKSHFRTKFRRFIPPEQLFYQLWKAERCKIFLTRYKGKTIGGSACVYSNTDAYLWFLAAKRKTFHNLHPDTFSVWQAIKHAHSNGYQHIRFLDVGLPYEQNTFRDFILSFGGKPVSKFRWFCFFIPWLNFILRKLIR